MSLRDDLSLGVWECQEENKTTAQKMTRGALASHKPAAWLPLWITELILWLSIAMTHVLFYFLHGLPPPKKWSMGGELHSPGIYLCSLSQPTSSTQSPHLSDVVNTTYFCGPILSNHDCNSEIPGHHQGKSLLLTRSVARAGTDMLI